MIRSLFFALLLAAFTVQSDVVELGNDSFATFINEEVVTLVEFFAPWCGHCKSLAPKYEEAATELKGIAKIAKVDCTAHEAVCSDHGVSGYPTLKVFRNGNATDYTGGRTAEDIVKFMTRQARASPLPIASQEELDALTAEEKVSIVGYFAEDDESAATFKAVSGSLRDLAPFGLVKDKAIATKKAAKIPSVVVYTASGAATYKGDLADSAKLTSFIQKESVPLIDDVGPQNYQKLVESGLPLAFIFIQNDEQRKELGATITPIAEENRGKVNFVFIDANQFGRFTENLNLPADDFPAFGIQTPKNRGKFPFKGDLKSAAELKTFVNGVVAGSITPDLKSEPIPEKNDGPVTVVVGKSYKDIVHDQTKDVLIEFYAPWCGHCKKLVPIWEELGTKLSAFKDKIVIAKMDGTENDLPADAGFEIKGFPTIKFFPAGADTEPVEYEGARELADFLEYLKKNVKNTVDFSAIATEVKEDEVDHDEVDHDEVDHDEEL